MVSDQPVTVFLNTQNKSLRHKAANCTRFASEFCRMRIVKRFKSDMQRVTRLLRDMSTRARTRTQDGSTLDSMRKLKPYSRMINNSRAGYVPLWNAPLRRLIYVVPILIFYWRNI